METEGKMKSFIDSVKGSIGHFRATVRRRVSQAAGPGAQQQLEDPDKITTSGVLRKLSRRTGHPSWCLVYAIVDQTHLHYYEDETSEHPIGSISLRGYNRVTRLEETDTVWTAFAIVPDTPDHSKVYTFATLSLAERKGWMEKIRQAMIGANPRVETSLKTAPLASKKIASLHKPRMPSPPPPSNSHEEELVEIEQPIYEVINDEVVAEKNTRNESAVINERDKSHASDRSITPPPCRIPRDPNKDPSLVKPTVKPTLPHKPPASPESTVSNAKSHDQSKTRPRPPNDSVHPPQQHIPSPQQLPEALLNEIRSSRNPPPLEPGPRPKVFSKKIRIYWSGSKDEASRAIQANSECGTYLIRSSEPDESTLVLVVRSGEGQPRKVKLVQRGGGTKRWSLATSSTITFDSLEQLVQYYSDAPMQLGGKQIKLTGPLEHSCMTNNVPSTTHGT